MSRPQKIHKPIKATFTALLAAVAEGSGAGKRTHRKLEAKAAQAKQEKKP